MNRPFMRKHVKQKPSVNGVELDLNQKVDFQINGKLKLLTVEDAIQTAPCLLRLRLYHPSTTSVKVLQFNRAMGAESE